MSNFIPNETKKIVPRNPPWITKSLKTMFKRKNRLFSNYKRHGYKAAYKVRLDAFRIECPQWTIPPLLVNNLFTLNCRGKARYFNDYFSLQCMPVINNSVLPILRFLTNKRIDNVTIRNDEIISLTRKINPNKETGSDGMSGQMLLLCDESVILPLQVIFTNILSTSIYPDKWKLANVTSIFKKGDKQLIKNYRPISQN